MTAGSGIKAVELAMKAGEHMFVVHAALLWDENDGILVDTGIPGQLEVIRNTLAQEAVSFDKLTKIIITHQDLDHIGSLPDLLSASEGRIEVFAHELTKPYILGETPIIKRGILVPPSKVDVTLQDGDELPYCGGIQVIFTPGHTPDHISLYHKPSKTLIAGDALTSNDGVLMPPNKAFTPDMEQALSSVGKLLDYDIETVITYHGGVCTERIKERLAAISAGEQ
ncbi:Glyoxylase, beta-lactamase superfamily II [Paenibacillus sp. 1_12]|uniref:MBL fold metallo-hydrolase n=1 Tax=Paenibacillus sp. 1_12 TaxID=1566278 RepID=UPI0008EC9FD5|nr:MBL fold metallo-hydrolase [Paenibacillus sp. 1_12]SFK96955.1 Glyoxylase, beta-lactamase superfamily II [Paenibacillus sp. 1_12]